MLILASISVGHTDDNIDRPGKGDWCYLAVHAPSQAEQQAFIDEVASAAAKASRKHGVPAAVLVGMAAVESGYGMTRIALKSNNIYAFKWPGSEIAKGYDKFVLWCQPDWDKGNEYPAFKSRVDAVDFVAWRLASSRHYKAATAAYNKSISRGIDLQQAALTWLEAIAPIYNYDGPAYVRKVSAVIRHPVKGTSISLWEMTR